MSILDLNKNYEMDVDESSLAYSGKFFWFSGYDLKVETYENIAKTESSQNEILEDDVNIYAEPITQSLNNGFHDDVNIYESPVDSNVLPSDFDFPVYMNDHVYETPCQNDNQSNVVGKKGRYFKLKGEFPDTDSDDEQPVTYVNENNVYEQPFPELPEEVLYQEIPNVPSATNNGIPDDNNNQSSFDDGDDETNPGGGTWFGFAGRQHRAQSLENLLDVRKEEIDPLDEQFKMIDQLVLESFDELNLNELEAMNDENFVYFDTRRKNDEAIEDQKWPQKENISFLKEVNGDVSEKSPSESVSIINEDVVPTNVDNLESEPNLPHYPVLNEKEEKAEKIDLEKLIEERKKVMNDFVEDIFADTTLEISGQCDDRNKLNTFPRKKDTRKPLNVNVESRKKSRELPERILNKRQKGTPVKLQKSHSFHSVPRRKKDEEMSFASKLNLFQSFDSSVSNEANKSTNSTAENPTPKMSRDFSPQRRLFDSPKQMRKHTEDFQKERGTTKMTGYSINAKPVKRPTHRVYTRSKTEDNVVITQINKKSPRLKVTQSTSHAKSSNTVVHSDTPPDMKYEYKNYLSKDDLDFIDSYTNGVDSFEKPIESMVSPETEQEPNMEMDTDNILKKMNLLKRQQKLASGSSLPNESEPDDVDYTSGEDDHHFKLSRNTSFRRSIVIEDEFGQQRRRKSTGGTCVSVFFTPISPQHKSNGDNEESTFCQQFKEVLTHLDNLVVSEINFGKDFEAVKRLHSLFWELKNAEEKSIKNSENLSSVLDFLVVQEWPKIMLGCLRKLKKSYPHVFRECTDIENTIYYSGHLPSLLRMNRTSSEFAISVIFDGLLKAAVNFTDHHKASRIACCEDNLVGYLLEDVLPQLHKIHWGKVTAREMFLKSICELVYNCAQTPVNASYLIEHDCVNVYTDIRYETFDTVDARKVNMAMLLTLSFLIDDNNYDLIIPREDSVIRLLQFLDRSLEHSEHSHQDFKAVELANCISRIAGHQANKQLITRNSGQEILHKLLKYSYTDVEKLAALNALWNVSFNREAKDILRGMGKLMNQLRELKASENPSIRYAASGILWECEEKYDVKGTRETCRSSPNHVMLSYEFESQPLVIGIRDELHRQGYKVWMNTDREERSLQEVMTRGVESATIVIAVITRKYKHSPHTFAEIDYAHTLRKLVIPVIVDIDFVPDGWLSELVQNEKTFDFSRRTMFSGSLDALTEYVKSLTGPSDKGIVKEVLVNTGSGKARSTDVLAWSNQDVIDWLNENQLIRSMSNTNRLKKLSGLHLLMFFDLKVESPDYYYAVLDSHLGFKDVLDTFEFTYALDRLLGIERLI